ncbi:MAG: hypothetical protein ABJD97_13090 [Betaproteobacteria bacterium]
MRNFVDFSSWQALASTLLGLVLVSLVAVGIRLGLMHTVQQRRERANRQINERLKTLIAAYKTLGGSFTGDLAVDPSHLRELRMRADTAPSTPSAAEAPSGSDRRRRMRDAVEAALSDMILLGTEEQVRLAAQAADDMAAGRRVETADLVVSLRTFIRDVLDLDPIPSTLKIPRQGALRTAGSAGRAGAGGGRGAGAGGANAGLGGAGMAPGATRAHDDTAADEAHRLPD